MSENDEGPDNNIDDPGHKFSIDLEYHYMIDPKTIKPEIIKEISDSVIADIANAVAGHRGEASGGFSKTEHVKAEGSIKW